MVPVNLCTRSSSKLCQGTIWVSHFYLVADRSHPLPARGRSVGPALCALRTAGGRSVGPALFAQDSPRSHRHRQLFALFAQDRRHIGQPACLSAASARSRKSWLLCRCAQHSPAASYAPPLATTIAAARAAYATSSAPCRPPQSPPPGVDRLHETLVHTRARRHVKVACRQRLSTLHARGPTAAPVGTHGRLVVNVRCERLRLRMPWLARRES